MPAAAKGGSSRQNRACKSLPQHPPTLRRVSSSRVWLPVLVWARKGAFIASWYPVLKASRWGRAAWRMRQTAGAKCWCLAHCRQGKGSGGNSSR